MEVCSVLCGSLDGRGVWGRMDTCMRVAAFLHCSPKTITTLLIGIPPNKMFLVLKILKLTTKKVCKQLFWRQQNLTVLRTQTDVPGPWV